MKKILIFLCLCRCLFADSTANIKNMGDILQIALPIYSLGYSYYNDDVAGGATY